MISSLRRIDFEEKNKSNKITGLPIAVDFDKNKVFQNKCFRLLCQTKF